MNTAPVDPKVKLKVRERFNGRCGYCGLKQWITVDHIKSRKHNGSNHPSNLMPSCQLCNHIKGSLSLSQFRRILKNKKLRERIWYKYVHRIDRRYSDFDGKFYYQRHHPTIDERNYRFYWNRAVKELARMAGL